MNGRAEFGRGEEASEGRAAAPDGTVAKALSVLDEIAASGGHVRFSELLERSPFPRATLHRLLATLAAEGMVARDHRSQGYTLGPRLLRLAHAAWTRTSLAAAAAPALDRLQAEIGETLHLATLDAGQVLYLDKRSARRVEMFSSVGKVGPAHCTGVGKAMLAFLPEPRLTEALSRQSYRRFTPATICDETALRRELARVREAGYAEDREEHEPGINCVAVPVIGGGALYGGLSVTGQTHVAPLAELTRRLPALRRAAEEIAAAAATEMVPSL